MTGRKLTRHELNQSGKYNGHYPAFYLYRIVEPLTGDHFFLEFYPLATVCFEQFLSFVCAFLT